MSMEWHGTLLFVGERCIASISSHVANQWHAVHHTWVHRNLKPTYTPCKTEAGIRRRCERYAQVWVVAGKPDGDAL